MMLLVIIAIIVVMLLLAKATNKSDSRKGAKTQLKFYEMCLENCILDISSDAKREKARLIAEQLGCYYTDLDAYYAEAQALYRECNLKEQERQLNAELSELRREEEKKYAERSKYTTLQGRNKRIKMLSDAAAEHLKRADNLERGMDGIIRASQEKEHDWATLGGFASGIAGGAAGVSVAVDAQIKNAQIREENKAKLALLMPSKMVIDEMAEEHREIAKSLENEAEVAKLKLVSDISKEEAMSYLSVKTDDIHISKTGAFIISASVEANKMPKIFNDLEAVVDGVICADVYQYGGKVGSALLTLPAKGVGEAATIEGMCLSGGRQNVPYTVKFSPHNLWVMEK